MALSSKSMKENNLISPYQKELCKLIKKFNCHVGYSSINSLSGFDKIK